MTTETMLQSTIADAAWLVLCDVERTHLAVGEPAVLTMDQEAYRELVDELKALDERARPDPVLWAKLERLGAEMPPWGPREYLEPWLGFGDTWLWGARLFLVEVTA